MRNSKTEIHQDLIPSEETSLLSNLNKIALKETAKKAGFLVAVSGVDISAEFLRVLLFSRLGLKTLAASSLIYATTKFLFDPFLLITNQNAVFISQEYGKLKQLSVTEEHEETSFQDETRYEQIGNIIRQGWYLSWIAAIPCALLLLASGSCIQLLGIDKEVSSTVTNYFIPVAFSVPFIFSNNINERFFTAVDKEKWLLPYRILMGTIIIGLNVVLIPQLGATGGGLAVLIQGVLSFLVTTLFITFKSDFKRYRLLNFRHYSGHYIKKTAKQGWPISLALFILTSINFAISIFVGHLGNLRLGIEQTVVQLFGIATTLAHGINEAGNRLIAQEVGENNYRLARFYGNVSLLSSATLFIIIAVIYNIIPVKLAGIFINENDRQGADNLIRYTFILISFAKLFTTVLDSTTLSLNALEDTFLPAAASFLTSMFVILPLAAMSTYITNFDIYGISGAISVGLFIAASMITVFWIKQSNKAVFNNDFDPSVDTSNSKFSFYISRCSLFNRHFSIQNQTEKLTDESDLETDSRSNEGAKMEN